MARFKEMAAAVEAEAKPKTNDAVGALTALVDSGMSKHACEAVKAALEAMEKADVSAEPTSIVAAGVVGEWVQMRWDAGGGSVGYSAVPEDQGPVVVAARLVFKSHADAAAALKVLLAAVPEEKAESGPAVMAEAAEVRVP